MRYNNIEILNDTLEVLKRGSYTKNGNKVELKLTNKQMEAAYVYLPDDIEKILKSMDFDHTHNIMGRCGFSCENIDSFSMAIKEYKNFGGIYDSEKEILVLNFANPVNPGGGVRRGARAQEEDLCTKSSLLLSLESKNAEKYYKFNRSLNNYMGSDSIILTPKVEIIKDNDGSYLDETVVVSVMTCAAPMVTRDLDELSKLGYEILVYNRIVGMLKCAAYWGYKRLVLGAWGCGAFGNDAKLISDLFYKALKNFDFDGMSHKDLFRRINFAVLDRSNKKYNFNEFYRNFGENNFYSDEDEAQRNNVLKAIKATEVNLDKIRGCLYGGAVGDALGYKVEFMSEEEIFRNYGENGITEYNIDTVSGKALISDDTQMTLFTANGLLVGDTRGALRGIRGLPRDYVKMAYMDWLFTQNHDKKSKELNNRISWLLDVKELYARRAPGNTCISALMSSKTGSVENPINNSKGCGGIMRVAPLALNYNTNIYILDREGAEIAAITHGHSLGYMPAAVLTHIINRILYNKKDLSLKDIVFEARDTVAEIFKGDRHLDTLINIINLAVELSENTDSDLNNIHKLGEGWVAEETLGIAIYCSLRYQNVFSKGVIAAVNHKGDSDSTGAVTGNILGVLLGYNAIDNKWKHNLEISDVILEMADDICHGCHMGEYSSYFDEDWYNKYIKMHKFE